MPALSRRVGLARWAALRAPLMVVAVASVGAGVACDSTPRTAEVVRPTIERDVPQLLRGTIGSMTTMRGTDPVLVSGIGIVVGLNGTGGDLLPDAVAATVEREMSLRGIGGPDTKGIPGIDGKSPRQILRDPNVAVVVVQAAIPPGSPEGAEFDVAVKAMNATSLEGGTLWTTDLRLGYASTFGSITTKAIAQAAGPIFINPFGDNQKTSTDITQTTGRILAGGRVTEPLGIEVVLDNESHAIARSMVSAINSRFPAGVGDRLDTARGRSGNSLELRIPGRYRRDPETYLNLIRFLRVDQSAPEQTALALAEGMERNPELADALGWSLEGVGSKALPFVRKLYETPETLTRLAALRTGARLGDPLAADHLADLARNGTQSVQTDAIRLLSKIDAGPRVDLALRDLLNNDDMLVRIAAYEALAERAERVQVTRLTNWQGSNTDPTAPRLTQRHLEVLARSALPAGTIQGVQRVLMPSGFFLDLVDSQVPMIYVTQQGQPRIVVFGPSMGITTPLTLSAWQDRFMLTTSQGDNTARVYYRPPNMAADAKPIIASTDARLVSLIDLMTRRGTRDEPRSGLSMSYSDVVGLLYQIQKQGGIAADFTTESDRLRALLVAAETSLDRRDRPETPKDREVMLLSPRSGVVGSLLQEPSEQSKPQIVPIAPVTPEK